MSFILIKLSFIIWPGVNLQSYLLIQLNLFIADTTGTKKSVRYKEVSVS